MNSPSSGQDSRSSAIPAGSILGKHVVGLDCQTAVVPAASSLRYGNPVRAAGPIARRQNNEICLFFRGRRRLEDFQEPWDSKSPFSSQNDKTALRQLPSVIPEFVKPKLDSFILKPLRQLVESSRTCVYPQRGLVGEPISSSNPMRWFRCFLPRRFLWTCANSIRPTLDSTNDSTTHSTSSPDIPAPVPPAKTQPHQFQPERTPAKR